MRNRDSPRSRWRHLRAQLGGREPGKFRVGRLRKIKGGRFPNHRLPLIAATLNERVPDRLGPGGRKWAGLRDRAPTTRQATIVCVRRTLVVTARARSLTARHGWGTIENNTPAKISKSYFLKGKQELKENNGVYSTIKV